MTKVSKEELQVIKVLLRLQPELFWCNKTWCNKPWNEDRATRIGGVVCSRPQGHEGPHVAAVGEPGSRQSYVRICTGTEPWYD